MSQLTTEQQRIIKILQNMIDMCTDDCDAATMFSDVLEPVLDDLASNGAFGTERRQRDPRGDCPEDNYEMSYVQGIDD